MIEIIPLYIFAQRISKRDGPEMYTGMMPNISLLVMQVKKEITSLILFLSLWRKSLTSNSSYFFVQAGGASGPQQVLIEGPLCEDYYKIRDYLYSQFFLL